MKMEGKTKAKSKKIFIIFVILAIFFSSSVALYAEEPETTEIACNDVNLYDALVEELDEYVYSSDRNTKIIKVVTTDINSIKQLKLTGKSTAKITDLTGLENFTNLENLNLSGNNITSVTPISGLTTLRTLNISGNETAISDIEELSNLTNLINVNFASSKLTNVEFMRNYTNLQTLDVSGNGISSLEPLKSISSLLEINIANNGSFSRLEDDIFCHSALTKLDISGTRVQSLEGIKALRNLESLKLRYLEIELNPIVATYKDEESEDNEKIPYLDKLNVLDISYTTESISFKEIAKLSSLKELYMIDVVGKWKDSSTTTKLSLKGIYELQDLNYINLASNNITDLSEMVYIEESDGEITEFKCLGATEIYLNDNNISDISALAALTKPIKILNLSYNKISQISLLDSCNFDPDREINLHFQNIELNIFKKDSIDQYIILPEIFQKSKNNSSLIYAENSVFSIKCNNIVDEENIKLNTNEPYLQPGNYNVIINKNVTDEDLLTVELVGNSIAAGSKLVLELGSSSSYLDSLVFKDSNLCSAIKNELLKNENQEKIENLSNAYMIMNIKNSAIRDINVLDLSVEEITDLSGLENFTELTSLNISENSITTIDVLQYCTKMVNLNVANNKIGDNNTSIKNMTKLEVLDLSNTGMTQINSLKTLIDYWTNKKKFTLTSLNLSGNNFSNTDIKGIEKISTLNTLKIANNNLTEIKDFEPLKNTISILDVSQNKIEDISTISSFTNLISLNLSNNKIKDISPVAVCSRLNELDFSVNKVRDISSLSAIAGTGTLIKLNMTNNHIEDVSAVDKVQINQLLLAENQKITKLIPNDSKGIITLDLPQIYIASKNLNSRFYSQKDVKISIVGKTENTDVSEYCTLSSTGASLQVNVDKIGGEIIIVKIQDGNADNTTLAIAPQLKGTITYSPSNKELTKQDITATISFNRTATITNNDGKNTYKFTKNGEFIFEYIDEYGFEGTATASVTNIDKSAPIITGVENGKKYNKQVTPVIQDENLKEIVLTKDGVNVPNYKSGTTISEAGKYVLIATDKVENTTTVSFEINVSDIITSSKVNVSENNLIITDISAETTVKSLKQMLNSEMEYVIINKDGNELKETELVGTGCKIKMTNNKNYTLVVPGDINGDGKIKLSDLSMLKLVLVGKESVDGPYKIASDINGDGNVKLSDLSKLKLYLVGKISL